jgi:hypothetical protein
MAASLPIAAVSTASLNPIETIILSFNSNPYFIGSMMLLLNLGGRHFATGLTPEQDKFFQQPWFRRALVFIVFFIGTRNILSSLWMSIIYILLIGYLFNDQSALYLFKPSIDKKEEKEAPLQPNRAYIGLTAEEADIHKKLQEKMDKASNNKKESPQPYDIPSAITNTYSTIMSRF